MCTDLYSDAYGHGNKDLCTGSPHALLAAAAADAAWPAAAAAAAAAPPPHPPVQVLIFSGLFVHVLSHTYALTSADQVDNISRDHDYS